MDIKELREKSFNFVRMNGPLLPVQISKFLDSNILIASAVLSDLVGQKKVIISSVKCGGSPFYYTPGQEFKLTELSKYLKGKQKDAYEIIKEKKVLRDRGMGPWERVAMREIKDFAKMIKIIYQDQEEIFWKWYQLNDDDTKGLIKKNYFMEKKEEKKVEAKEEVKAEEKKPEVEKEEKPEVQKKLKEEKKVKPIGEFYDSVMGYFNEKRIKIIDEEVKRKNKEFDFIAEIPSSLGMLKFYIKVKDKKKINDADLSLAYSEGKSQNLNVLFMSHGELTKKAKELIEKRFNGFLIFKKIE